MLHFFFFFDPDSPIINKKHIEGSNTVASSDIRYITKWDNAYQKIPVCLRFTDVDAYFIKENQNKFLIFALTENNGEEILGPYKNFGVKLKSKLKP